MKTVVLSGQMEGLNVDRASRDTAYNMVKHWHPECEIQYFYQGKRHFFIDQRQYLAKSGCLVIVDAQQVHNTYSDKNPYHDRMVVHIDKERFQESAKALGIDIHQFFIEHRGLIQIPQADRPYVESCLHELAEELGEKKHLYQTVAQLRLFDLIVYLKRLKNTGARQKNQQVELEMHEIVNEIGHYIRKHYASVGSLEEIAKQFYLDKCYLSRIFKRCTGYTVSEFTNVQRIQQAQRLLEDTELSMADIANAVGYENISYFNRVFKKYIETSPLKYRKKQNIYKKSLREKNNL